MVLILKFQFLIVSGDGFVALNRCGHFGCVLARHQLFLMRPSSPEARHGGIQTFDGFSDPSM